MSEYFGVTTDYILKGIEPIADKDQNNSELTSKILYIASTAFVAIGMFSAFAGWYETQTMDTVWGSMIIQAVGVAGYFIGRLLSAMKPPFVVNWMNLIGLLFMPASMVTGAVSIALFKQGWVAPYPIGVAHVVLFLVFYISICAMSFVILRRWRK